MKKNFTLLVFAGFLLSNALHASEYQHQRPWSADGGVRVDSVVAKLSRDGYLPALLRTVLRTHSPVVWQELDKRRRVKKESAEAVKVFPLASNTSAKLVDEINISNLSTSVFTISSKGKDFWFAKRNETDNDGNVTTVLFSTRGKASDEGFSINKEIYRTEGSKRLTDEQLLVLLRK